MYAKHPLAPERNNILKHKSHIGARYAQPAQNHDGSEIDYSVTVENFTPITDDQPTLAPDYSRGSLSYRAKGNMSATGQTILGIHLTNGVNFRKVSATREELKVSGGKLVLRMGSVKGQKFWFGEYHETGVKQALVLVALQVIKGEPPVKGDARDLLVSRAVLSEVSIY